MYALTGSSAREAKSQSIFHPKHIFKLCVLLIILACLFEAAQAKENNHAGEDRVFDDVPSKPIDRKPGHGPAGELVAQALMPELFSGSLVLEYPIDLPRLRSEPVFVPKLSYRSRAGRSEMGIGWLPLFESIRRQGQFDVNYATREFELVTAGSAMELVATSATSFSPVIESRFDRIQMHAEGGAIRWVRNDKWGNTFEYGSSSDHVIYKPGRPPEPYAWLLSEVHDTMGNAIRFSYDQPGTVGDYVAQPTLESIAYEYRTDDDRKIHAEVLFRYEPRSDIVIDRRPKFSLAITKRLVRIDVLARGEPYTSYEVAYRSGSPGDSISLVETIQRVGSDGSRQPSTTFGYGPDSPLLSSPARIGRVSNGSIGYWDFDIRLGDFNGDGKEDVLNLGQSYTNNYPKWHRDINVAIYEGGQLTNRHWIQARDISPRRNWYVADVNGDGKSDVINIGRYDKTGFRGDVVRVFLSDGTKFLDAGVWSSATPFRGFSPDDAHFVDVNADGLDDLLFQPWYQHWRSIVALSNGSTFGQPTVWLDDTTTPRRGPLAPFLLADLNGDGLPDLLDIAADGRISAALNQGGRFGDVYLWGTVGNGDRQQYCFADFNGDQIADILYFDRPTAIHVFFSKGFGLTEQVTLPYQFSGVGRDFNLGCDDFNGDGWADAAVTYRSSATSGSNIDIAYSNGTTLSWAYSGDTGFGSAAIANRVFVRNFDGVGAGDFLHYAPDGTVTLTSTRRNVVPLVRSISNTTGGRTEVQYAYSSEFDNTYLPFSLPVVGALITHDRNGNPSTDKYTYEGGYFHAATREFRGFKKVTRRHQGERGQEDFSVTTEFHQGDGGTPELMKGPAALKGQLRSRTVRDSGGGVVFEEGFEYHSDIEPSEVVWYQPVRETRKKSCTHGATCAERIEEFEYDKYGNLKSLKDTIINPGVTTASIRRFDYSEDETRWLVGLPIKDELYTIPTVGVETLSHRVRFWYDGATTSRLPISTELTVGLLTAVSAHNDQGADVLTTFEYDQNGNLSRFIDPSGVENVFLYDDWGVFVRSAYRAGQLTSELSYYGVDGEPVLGGFFGKVKSLANSNGRGNLLVKYDPFGRLIMASRGGNQPIQVQYNDALDGDADISLLLPNGVRRDFVFDGFGRPTYVQQSDSVGNKVGRTITYSSLGSPSTVSAPFFDTPTNVTSYRYGPEGRIQLIEDGIGKVTRYCYRGPFTDEIVIRSSEVGRKLVTRTIVERDLRGLVRSIGKVHEPGQECTEQAGGKAMLQFSHDGAGRLTAAVDAQGNKASYQYDTVGRPIRFVRPDLGEMEFTYSSSQQLDGILSGSLCKAAKFGRDKPDPCWIASYTYDDFNRLVKESYAYGRKSVNVSRKYEVHPFGLLKEAQLGRTRTRFSYDTLGRIIGTSTRVGYFWWFGKTYEWASSLDSLGREYEIKFPNTAIELVYDGMFFKGYFNKDNKPIVLLADHRPDGRPGVLHFADGSREQFQWSKEGLLKEVLAYDSDNRQLFSEEYTYLGDWLEGRTQIEPILYSYDYAGRLVSSGDKFWRFDSIGNLVESSDAGAIEYGLADLPYSPSQFGDSKFTSIAGIGLAQVTGDSTIVTLSPTPLGRPGRLEVRENASVKLMEDYSYDAFGNLVETRVRHDPTGGRRTLRSFLNSTFCEGRQCRNVLRLGQRPVAILGGPDDPTFLHTDVASSVVARTSDGSLTGEIARYDPWGKVLTSSYRPDEYPQIGYAGHDYNPRSSLSTVGVRFYSPIYGRFTAPDWFTGNLDDIDGLNPYTYGRNNPQNFVDLRGYSAVQFGGSSYCDWNGSACGDSGFSWTWGGYAGPGFGGGSAGSRTLQIPTVPMPSTQELVNRPMISAVRPLGTGQVVIEHEREYGFWLGTGLTMVGAGAVTLFLIGTAPVTVVAGLGVLSAGMLSASGFVIATSSVVQMTVGEPKAAKQFSEGMQWLALTSTLGGLNGAVLGGILGGDENSMRTGAAIGNVLQSTVDISGGIRGLAGAQTEVEFVFGIVSTLNNSYGARSSVLMLDSVLIQNQR